MNSATITRRGLADDRRWMLVDSNNRFITQRERPKMSLLGVKINEKSLVIHDDAKKSLEIPKIPVERKAIEVVIWKSKCIAMYYEDEVNSWLSERLGMECRLVYMPEETYRSVNPLFRFKEDDHVSFADGYPFMIIGEGSLSDLNSRLRNPVPMNRFRPNFVVNGSGAFEEDDWKRIQIGKTIFRVVKPCERCVIPTIDQETGTADSNEPLKTLADFRRQENKILFGQNLIAEIAGEIISVGDEIKILE